MIILQSAAGPGIANLLFFLALFSIMYFFFLRPQVKKQKAQESFSDGLSKGDRVVTTSGIIGTVVKIDKDSILLAIDQKTNIKLVSGAISKEMTEKYTKEKSDS